MDWFRAHHFDGAVFGSAGAYALVQSAAFHDCAWKIATLVIGAMVGGATKWALDKAWATGTAAWERRRPAPKAP